MSLCAPGMCKSPQNCIGNHVKTEKASNSELTLLRINQGRYVYQKSISLNIKRY